MILNFSQIHIFMKKALQQNGKTMKTTMLTKMVKGLNLFVNASKPYLRLPYAYQLKTLRTL